MDPIRVEMLQFHGAPVQIYRGGHGAPLLYLHSAGGEFIFPPFRQVLGELANHFEVIAPAHPGFGGSEGLERIDDIEDLAFHYLDLLDALKLERVNVVGMSLGGWLAAELATRSPERVRSLVLVDAAGLYIPRNDNFEFFLDQYSSPGYSAEMRRRSFHDPESPVAHAFVPDEIPFDQLLFFYRARQATARVAWNPYFYNPKLRQRLHRVKCPALVLWGDSDGLLPVEHAQAYHELIPGSTLQVLEKCGHLPPLERPEEFVASVVAFLNAERLARL